MDTPFLNHQPALPRSLVSSGILRDTFTIVDVGASGGIPNVWYSFGDRLRAFAFDPLTAEVERLNSAKPAVGTVQYVDAYIVRSSEAQDESPNAEYDIIGRSSTWRSLKLTSTNRQKETYNSGAELRYSQNRYSIDEFMTLQGVSSVDFIKTDTDGHDYAVLLGARETLTKRGVLGVVAEVNFNSHSHPQANLLANNDLYLRSLGFSLFDLDVRRYTRAALPGKFRHNIPAQTVRGQLGQADVLYLRDFLDADFRAKCSDFEATNQRLLKMVCLFEIFGLNDCAIELINAYGETLKEVADLEQLKSVLTEEASGEPDYAAYIDRFENFVKAKQYATFPDGYAVAGEGFLMMRDNDPKTAVFRRS